MEPISAARRLYIAATLVLSLSSLGAAILVVLDVYVIRTTSGDHTAYYSAIGGTVGAWLVTITLCFAGQALAAHIANMNSD